MTANVSEEDFDDSWTDDFVEVSQSRTCCPTDAEKNEKSFRNIGTNTPFVADVEEVKSGKILPVTDLLWIYLYNCLRQLWRQPRL